MKKVGFIKGYPANPETIGEHLKKRRMELSLLQKDVALQFMVSEETISNWEIGRAEPQIRHAPVVIAFLGYYPWAHEAETFSGNLLRYRHTNGYSHKRLGKLLGVNGSTVQGWEAGLHLPQRAQREALDNVIQQNKRTV